jgi:hypothetical protein
MIRGVEDRAASISITRIACSCPKIQASQLFELRTRACMLYRLIPRLNHPGSSVPPHHMEVRERTCAESPDATLISGYYTLERRQSGREYHGRIGVAYQWLLRAIDMLGDGRHVNLNRRSGRVVWSAAKADKPQENYVSKWLLNLADSTGECNSLMESFGWRLIIQSPPWTLIQSSRHGIQLGLRIHRQVGTFREVLPRSGRSSRAKLSLKRPLALHHRSHHNCARVIAMPIH